MIREPAYDWSNISLTIGGRQLPSVKAVFVEDVGAVDFGAPPDPIVVTGSFEIDAAESEDFFASLIGYDTLPPPRCHVERYVFDGVFDGGLVWEQERWYRRADLLTNADGTLSPAYGSWEVDVFDELYVDYGGESG